MKKLISILSMAFGLCSLATAQLNYFDFKGKFDGRNFSTIRSYPNFKVDSLIFSTDSVSIHLKGSLTKYSLNSEVGELVINTPSDSELGSERNITLDDCYGGLPSRHDNSSKGLDFFTGDEVVTSFEYETFGRIVQGGYSAEAPSIEYWSSLYKAIVNCYWFREHVSTGSYSAAQTTDYLAQTDFLIAYYHYLLIRSYGPIVLVKEVPGYVEEYSGQGEREHLDRCVDFVVDLLDRAALTLKSSPSESDLNVHTTYPTPVVAKSIKAKLLLYVASPLFNASKAKPNTLFGANGYNPSKAIARLVPATYDVARWERARVAAKEALDAAHAQGHKLYTSAGRMSSFRFPMDKTQRDLRFALCDTEGLVKDSELIWGDAREEGAYGLQKKSMPYWNNGSWNGVAPTEAMLNRFFTENGLPLKWDKNIPDNLEELYTAGAIPSDKPEWGRPAVPIGVRYINNTVKMALNREPRFYAWVSFHGGYYEVQNNSDNNMPDYNPYHEIHTCNEGLGIEKGCGRVVTNFLKNGPCGTGERTNNYSLTGFLNKKGVHPGTQASAVASSPTFYHWPLIRLADLYLMYAEASVECANSSDAGLLQAAREAIDPIRERAGLKSVEETYTSEHLKNIDKTHYLTQGGMREIVRRERMVEMYLENQNFWDMRRWLLAGDQVEGDFDGGSEKEGYFGVKPLYGMNIRGISLTQFAKRTALPVPRQFRSPSNYLLPIPARAIDVNVRLIQNPGYNDETADEIEGMIGMVDIPGGTFTMGSPATEVKRESDETQHRVTLSAFKLGKYEVTQGLWNAVIGGNPSEFKGDNLPVEQVSWNDVQTFLMELNQGLWNAVIGGNPSEFKGDNLPVEQVSWNDVQTFLMELNLLTGKTYSLPTEAQWEYACRAGTTTPFNTGSCLTNSQANYYWQNPYGTCTNTNTSYPGKTQSVGSYAPNSYGLYDMHGNVYEWCSDWYGTDPTETQTNPTGPTSGTYRVSRGGSWNSNAQDCRSAIRYGSTPGIRDNDIGFRLALCP